MINFRKIILIILCLIIFQKTYAITSNNTPLTLKDCIQKALENSPRIKNRKINYEMSKHNLAMARAQYFPTLGAGVSYNFNDTEGSNRNTRNNSLGVNASIRQLIWDFGRTNANINMEKFYKIVAFYDFDTEVLDTILDIKVKYYTALAAKTAIDVDLANLQINERNYQRTNAYFEEGLKSKIDLVNAEVYVTQAKSSLISTENAYKVSLSDLNNAMYLAYNPQYNLEVPSEFKSIGDFTPKSLTDSSRPIEDFLSPPENISDATLTAKVDITNYASKYKFDVFPYSFEKCLEIANQNRPDIKAYEATVGAMKEYKKSITRSVLPTLSAVGSYNFNEANSNITNTNNSNSFGVGLDFSTSFNIANEIHEHKNADLQIDIAENDLESLKQNVYFEVQKAYIDMMEYESQIPLLEQKIQQTLENLELADGRYNVGLGDYIELQTARINYNSAQHSFINAVFRYNVAKANLEKVIAADQEVTIKLED